MGRAINREELVRHLEILDGRTSGDVDLYRHLMSKDEESGDVEGRSYLVGSGYNKIMDELDEEHHQYVTPALFSSPDVRRKSTIRATSGLYVDLDDSLFRGDGRIGLDLVHDSIRAARLPEPTMVIYTGGGFHVYWLFKDLYYINGDEDIHRYEEVIKSIIESLSIIGADPKSKDVTRLLRLAGTYNYKYDSSPAVMIIESNDVYYDLEDFEGLHVVKKINKLYDSPFKKSQPQVVKQSLTQDEPTANKESVKQSRVINKPLTRPEEDFPTGLIPEIIVDAQDELERRDSRARYMEELNQEVIDDLLLNYINLPRNTFVFEDGTSGQYIQDGHRNHFLWILARRGVSDKHLSLINRTLLLPSLNHNEFMNVLKVGRKLKIPRISSIIDDLGITLEEQSVLMTLRVDYEKILEQSENTVRTRIDQVTTESNRKYIQENPNKPVKVVAEELDISTSSVYHHKNKKGGEPRMTRDERIQELSNIRRNVERTGRIAFAELLEDYQLAGEVLDRIIKNQTLIYNLRVPLTPEQQDEIRERAESLASKVSFILSQIDAYEAFIVDESEYFKSGKIKKSVLLNKLNVLKDSTRLITV